MKITELKKKKKKYNKEELESIVVELYKRIPKYTKEDYNIDNFIINIQNDIKTKTKKNDEIDFNELTKDSIRGNLSVISQNAYIFNMSIEDNLRIIKKNATKKEIEKACKMACLDEFIESLPNKYKTIVGEGGVTLSGGQRQRIAIARALLLNTEVLLFDEATSSLDNTTQEKIQKAIENLKGKYTILIIAHRLSTVINSDKIYVINKGTVEGVGTHKELLKTCKIYADLYKNEDNKSK